jgi:membrane protease YdiL (CAAX protease family)
MNPLLVERLTSRKFWAFIIGVVAAFVYAFGLIDEKGLAAIIASVAAYNVGEGLADFGQNRHG